MMTTIRRPQPVSMKYPETAVCVSPIQPVFVRVHECACCNAEPCHVPFVMYVVVGRPHRSDHGAPWEGPTQSGRCREVQPRVFLQER